MAEMLGKCIREKNPQKYHHPTYIVVAIHAWYIIDCLSLITVNLSAVVSGGDNNNVCRHVLPPPLILIYPAAPVILRNTTYTSINIVTGKEVNTFGWKERPEAV
jgi:hypothetical protein